MPIPSSVQAAPHTLASGPCAAAATRYAQVRAHSLALAATLTAEDQGVQSMPDASPTKWHLAHTSWFFETVVLAAHVPGYRAFDPAFGRLFNSYYESLGPRHPRPQRGLLTRPSLDEVHAYRAHVDTAMQAFLAGAAGPQWEAAAPLVELGLQHEQQHQELIATDILHAFSCNPLLPAWKPQDAPALRLASQVAPVRWLAHPGGTVDIGHAGEGFAFDNETPRHAVLLQPFELADRLVTCGEYLAFVEEGGYGAAGLWLSDGWAAVQAQGWQAPAHWLAPGDPRAPSDRWQVFGPAGVRPLDAAAPVTQLSFYEAAAYAEWAGARLPTEAEWEAMWDEPGITQMTGHAWQWTRSSYDPYPGFRPLAGTVGEYNGKFMVGQLVLRGGSAYTPPGHARRTYRNFFPPAARWQCSGLRLAREVAR
ncbi:MULTISPECIES: ergothioneine biosynthesis protein EgtB [Ramlibacter]|uniref:Ergothioneine biosynthesis protein EgtB n=1 Tax=Ramlibacter pinisoli TaxID=2682844 RepID=A0A6N8IPN6_9BURK|nr:MULTISPECIES: ergothioneine biosynthesis protein EgtB [Ramlibacter]MBA2963883.1 ergothioneine biosynthesis protein EgtB [Ramlibacter sp. CGMCC 1.13660]MVQ28849.1 ergothioneine biosynthesis protein EgtB [Ramlibacter pinisoli]